MIVGVAPSKCIAGKVFGRRGRDPTPEADQAKTLRPAGTALMPKGKSEALENARKAAKQEHDLGSGPFYQCMLACFARQARRNNDMAEDSMEPFGAHGKR